MYIGSFLFHTRMKFNFFSKQEREQFPLFSCVVVASFWYVTILIYKLHWNMTSAAWTIKVLDCWSELHASLENKANAL